MGFDDRPIFVCIRCIIFFSKRIYIEKDGVRVEIGDGYSVGPGHGLIVSKIGDNIRVTPLLNSFDIYIWNISWK